MVVHTQAAPTFSMLHAAAWVRGYNHIIINPRRMREGYCSRSVCVSVSLSVCLLTL